MTKKEKNIVGRSAADWKTSERHGAGTWLAERGTSLALVPLTFWGAYAAYVMAGTGYDGARAFLAVPLNAGLAALTLLLSVWHMYMGLRVIIEDYFSKEEGRGLYLFLVLLFSLALVVAGLGGLYLVYRGA